MHIITQLISAFHYLHDTANIVHRDLKPQNLLIEHYELYNDSLEEEDKVYVKLTDFGFATTGTYMLKGNLGTPAY